MHVHIQYVYVHSVTYVRSIFDVFPMQRTLTITVHGLVIVLQKGIIDISTSSLLPLLSLVCMLCAAT